MRATERILIMTNIYKCGLEKLKYSAKCKYNHDKTVVEHLKHIQCKVLTFVMVIYTVCDNKHDIVILTITISVYSMWQIFDHLVERWS